MAKYEEEPPELMKKWHLAIILEGQWKIMLYFTWIWGDKLYRIKLTEKGAQNVHICVHFTVNLLLKVQVCANYLEDIMTIRETSVTVTDSYNMGDFSKNLI